jgi:hypothetical protein
MIPIPDSQEKIIKKLSAFYDEPQKAYEMLLKAWRMGNSILISEDTKLISRIFVVAEVTLYNRRNITKTAHSVRILALHLDEAKSTPRDPCAGPINGTKTNCTDMQYHGCVV